MGGGQSTETPPGRSSTPRRSSQGPPPSQHPAGYPPPTPYPPSHPPPTSSTRRTEDKLRNVTNTFFDEQTSVHGKGDKKTVTITEEQLKEFELLKSQVDLIAKNIKVSPKPVHVETLPQQNYTVISPIPPVHPHTYVHQNHHPGYGYPPSQVYPTFSGPNIHGDSIFNHPPLPLLPTPSGINQANYVPFQQDNNKSNKNVDDLIAFLESPPVIEEIKPAPKPEVPVAPPNTPGASTGAIPRTSRTPQHIFTSEVVKPKAFNNNNNNNRSKSIPRPLRNQGEEQTSEKPSSGHFYNRGRGGRGYNRGGYHGSQDNLDQPKGYYRGRGGKGYNRENVDEKSSQKEEKRQYYQNRGAGGRGYRGGSRDNLNDGNKSSEKGDYNQAGHPNRGRGGGGGKGRGSMTSHGSRGDLDCVEKSSEKGKLFVELKPEEGKKGKEFEKGKENEEIKTTKVNNNSSDSVDQKNKKDYKKDVIEINPVMQLGAKNFIDSLSKPNVANNTSISTTENKDIKTTTLFEKNEIPSKVKKPSDEKQKTSKKGKKNVNKEAQVPVQQTEINPDEAAAKTLTMIREATVSGEYSEEQLQVFINKCNEYFETQVSKVLNVQPTKETEKKSTKNNSKTSKEKDTKSEEIPLVEKLPEIPINDLRSLLPSHWALVKYPIIKSHIPVELHPESPEYIQLSMLFHRSVKQQMNIESIARIENAYLWFMYLLKKEEITKYFGYEPEEKILFHGTDNYNLNSIFENNFNWRKLNRPRHKFGQGVTFSPLASNASIHSRGHPKSHRNLVVSRVLICHEKIGTEDTLVPPFGFDTTKRPDGKIVVKFDDYTFYPEHVITFSGAMLRNEEFNSPFKKVNIPAPKQV